jgi:hypothetical protein
MQYKTSATVSCDGVAQLSTWCLIVHRQEFDSALAANKKNTKGTTTQLGNNLTARALVSSHMCRALPIWIPSNKLVYRIKQAPQLSLISVKYENNL